MANMSLIISQRIENAKVKIRTQLDIPVRSNLVLRDEFVFSENEESLFGMIQSLKTVDAQSLKSVVQKVFMKQLEEDKSSKLIFGTKEINLEGVVSRGWLVENLLEGFKVNDEVFIVGEEFMKELRVKYQ